MAEELRRRHLPALAMVALLLCLGGCGEGSGEPEATKESDASRPASSPTSESAAPPVLKVTLDGEKSAATIGLLLAEQQEFFLDKGLDPWIVSPILPKRPIEYVWDRIDSVGVVQEPQLALAKSEGAPLVAVGSLVSQPTGTMIWLKRSGIDSIEDLRGKTIAVPGVPFQKAFLESALASSGLSIEDVKVVDAGYDLVPALLGGRADAIFGGSGNIEGAELEAAGSEPVVTPVESLGLPSYEELLLVVREDFLAEHRQLVRDFVAAVSRGTAAALKHPAVAAKLLEEAQVGKPKMSHETIEAQVAATLPLLSRNARMSAATAEGLADWMEAEGMLPQELSASTLLADGTR
jgi:putative hydroxymethylpyrimidine transport system substrate-binding protein